MGAVCLNSFFDPDLQTYSLPALSDKSSADAAVFIAGAASNVMLTILDWGYANLKLKTKQDKILFKYRRKPDLRSVDILDKMKKNIHLP